MPNVNQIIIVLVVIVIVVVGIFLFSTGKIATTGDSEEEALVAGALSLAGQVISVDAENNSFVMRDQQSQQEFTVEVGSDTDFVRLGFPFDPASPPEDLETFVPERQSITIQELIDGDFVFVRSSHEVESGKAVVDPLEVQILP